MSVKLRVDSKELKKSAKRIEKHLETLNGEINGLYTDDLYQLAESWKDKAHYEWANKFTDYLEDLKNVSDSIAGYVAYLRLAADEYEKTLTESANTVQAKVF